MNGRPRSRIYKVKKGDTLWDIAKFQYGDHKYWPEIGKANSLKDPNIILVGQELNLPDLSSNVRVARPAHDIVSHRPARPVLAPSFKYNLDLFQPSVFIAPPFKYELKLTGEVIVQSKKTLESISFTNDAVVVSCRKEADAKLIKMFSDAKVKWDTNLRSVNISCGFTVASKVGGQVWTSTSIEVMPNGIKFTVQPKEVQGEVEEFHFKGNIGFEGSITRQDQPLGLPQEATETIREASKWVGIGLLIVAGTIVVATLGEDIVTGVGLFNDPISFAAAAELAKRAIQILRPIQVPIP